MRSRLRHALPALLLAALLAPRLAAWEWAGVTVDRDSLRLGDPLVLTLKVRAAAGERVDWPLPARAELGGWRLLGADSLEEAEGGERLLARRLQVARYTLGPAPLPVPGPLRGRERAFGDTLRLEILASLPDTTRTPADILAPGRMPYGWRWWAAWAALAAALAAAAWLGLRWWRRRVLAPPPELVLPPDPWHDFLARMGQIEARGLWRSGQVESHYAGLSLALRGLLEDCLGLPCRERSTEELRGLLVDTPLDDADLAELFRLLEENDWVKYARRWPDAETCARQVERYQKWALLRRDRLLARHRALLEAAELRARAATAAAAGRVGA